MPTFDQGFHVENASMSPYGRRMRRQVWGLKLDIVKFKGFTVTPYVQLIWIRIYVGNHCHPQSYKMLFRIKRLDFFRY